MRTRTTTKLRALRLLMATLTTNTRSWIYVSTSFELEHLDAGSLCACNCARSCERPRPPCLSLRWSAQNAFEFVHALSTAVHVWPVATASTATAHTHVLFHPRRSLLVFFSLTLSEFHGFFFLFSELNKYAGTLKRFRIRTRRSYFIPYRGTVYDPRGPRRHHRPSKTKSRPEQPCEIFLFI